MRSDTPVPAPQHQRGRLCAEAGLVPGSPIRFANPQADFEWQALFELQQRDWLALSLPRFLPRRRTPGPMKWTICRRQGTT
jgi:hypothetical protein